MLENDDANRFLQFGTASVPEWRNLWYACNRDLAGKLLVLNLKFPPRGTLCGKIMNNRYYNCGAHENLIFQVLAERYNLSLGSMYEWAGLIQNPDPKRMAALISFAVPHLLAATPISKGVDLGLINLISDPPNAYAYCQQRDQKDWAGALNPLNILTPFDTFTWLLVLATLLTAALLNIKRGYFTALFESCRILLKSGVRKCTVVFCIWSLSGTLITYGPNYLKIVIDILKFAPELMLMFV